MWMLLYLEQRCMRAFPERIACLWPSGYNFAMITYFNLVLFQGCHGCAFLLCLHGRTGRRTDDAHYYFCVCSDKDPPAVVGPRSDKSPYSL